LEHFAEVLAFAHLAVHGLAERQVVVLVRLC
jgi:hypothetical protein